MSCVGRELRFAGVFKPYSAEDVSTVITFRVSVWGESLGSPELSSHVCWQRR